ncbi:MAG: VOC family protein [Anaerolineae bacterium]|nr:VOC family protein [Anaerolineae bacterium]
MGEQAFSLTPHHVGISVPDLDSAIAWYGEVLGFGLERQMEVAQIPARIAWLRRDGFRIELFEVGGAAALPEDRRVPNRDLKTHGTKHVAFAVADVDAFVADLRVRGVDIAMHTRIHGEPMAFIRDNAGTLIEIVQVSSFEK